MVRDLKAIETRLEETATELMGAKSRIASMATDGAALVKKACPSLLHASRVRIAAETREREISRLEGAAEAREREISRLEAARGRRVSRKL